MSPDEMSEEAERIEKLLDEVQGMIGPIAWPRIEELIQRILGYHGRGLERLLGVIVEVAGDQSSAIRDAILSDELIGSLLLLHGLHPEPVLARIERALESVRPYLASHRGGVELIGFDAGTARLRLLGGCRGCPSSRATIEQAIERAIVEAAPEVERIEVDDGEPQPAEQLVRIGSRTRWISLGAIDPIAPGGRHALNIGGAPILLLNLRGTLQAYRNECGACGAALDDAQFDERSLDCSCGMSFDLSRAGVSASGSHLRPVPLLVDGGVPRIALEAA